ncbi:hypothetical protein FMM68_10805 [Lachnospiraceae bacterium MD329]|nr:hypothetical protein [Lachnospiraceae bacterium MD329]
MPAYKDKNRGKWYVSFYYENYNGVREKKMKRGFDTKKDALEWEREYLRQAKVSPSRKNRQKKEAKNGMNRSIS